VYEIRKRNGVFIVVPHRRGLAPKEWTDLSTMTEDDLIGVHMKTKGRETTKDCKYLRKINYHRIIRQGGGKILAGDINAHSHRWDPRCKEQRDATFWEEIIAEHVLKIGNDDQPTDHWARNSEEGESTIELTLSSRPIIRRTRLDGTNTTCSYHEVIVWQLTIGKTEEADPKQVIAWNMAVMSKEDEEAAEKLAKSLDGQRAHRMEVCTGGDVEQQAERGHNTLSQVLDGKAKKIRICALSKR
jgi:hypothetical protein